MSNWKSLVLGTDTAGKIKVLKGPDVSTDEQRKFITGFLSGKDLPKDIVKVELVTRANGVVKTATEHAAETPEDAVARDVRGLSLDEILKELAKPTGKQKADKSLAEAALVAQRLNEPASPPASPPREGDPGSDRSRHRRRSGSALDGERAAGLTILQISRTGLREL